MSIRIVSLLAVLLDQASKFLIVRYCRLGESIPVIHNILYLTYIRNPGAAFGFMADFSALVRIPFFILITIGAGLIVYSYQRFIPGEKKWMRFSLGLIWGGAMGNFIDRIFYRQVVDFIDVQRIKFGSISLGLYRFDHFPYIFNVADSCITVGLTILVLSHWFENKGKTAI
jgi:signal peptidase II